jgi:hypothetical protein
MSSTTGGETDARIRRAGQIVRDDDDAAFFGLCFQRIHDDLSPSRDDCEKFLRARLQLHKKNPVSHFTPIKNQSPEIREMLLNIKRDSKGPMALWRSLRQSLRVFPAASFKFPYNMTFGRDHRTSAAGFDLSVRGKFMR